MSASIPALTQYFSANQAVLIGTNNGGWSGRSPTEKTAWKYGGSATTITVTTDATTYYSVGDRIRLKQGGSYKYFYIVGVASTTLTITGGSDYTLTNADITDVEVSKEVAPLGFPVAFAYTPSWSGFSVNPSGGVIRFSLVGNVCRLHFQSGGGTSNATGFAATLPINARTIAGAIWNAYGNGNDNTVTYQNLVLAQISSGGSAVSFSTNGGSANWTAAGTKNVNVTNIVYEI